MPADLLGEAITRFGCGFAQLYGMTETAGAITGLSPEDHDVAGNARMRSVGHPLPGVELLIVDADGCALPGGEVGEILIRSGANMAGYHNLPAATAEALDAEGWIHTGDAGYCDEDGYLYLVDRIKDMIITGGENVYPMEVEQALSGHPLVQEVAVIGVPDAKWGEAVKAIVVATPGAEPDPAELIGWVRQYIAAYKAPKSIAFRSELPRNASGKVLRRQLRQEYD
jgi:acyl-CoA synthetase (AMP-forming)/AMP-acid ligase II